MPDQEIKQSRILLILIALLFGIAVYLKSQEVIIQKGSWSFLSPYIHYLPWQVRTLCYGILFFCYINCWYSNSNPAKGLKAFFWAHFISLAISWCVLLWRDFPGLNNLLAYILGDVYKGGWPIFWSWVTYLITLFFMWIFTASFYGLMETEVEKNEKLVRGKRFLNLDEARDIASKKLENDGPGVRFGWLTLPESQATTHFAIVGATGSGKTLIIRRLLDSVLPRVGTGSDCRALIYDPKRDFLPILAGMNLGAPVFTLHPFDKRGVGWNMAADILSPASADQMATILIPHEKQSSNPFFTDAARALMTGVLTVFIKKCPGIWTFRDVIVALKSATRLKAVLSECEETIDLVEQYFSNDRTANDVISTIATKIQRYQYIAAAWEKAEKKISLKDWVNSEYILILGNDEETRSAVDALNQVIFKRITELLLNQTESFTRRTWVVLDELKEAGHLPGLSTLLSKGRSKGTCVVIGFQDIEGLGAAMRDSRVANETVGLCANKAILRIDSAETAKWASFQFGDQEVEQRKVSTSSGSSSHGTGTTTSTTHGVSWVNLKKQAVMPVEFLDLPPVEKNGQLHGYYIIPSIGTYYAGIRMSGEDSILSTLCPLDSETSGFIERDKEEQYLQLWKSEDIDRLKLYSLKKIEDDFTKEREPIHIEAESVKEEHTVDPLDLIKRN